MGAEALNLPTVPWGTVELHRGVCAESRFGVDKFVQWPKKMKPHNTLGYVGIDQRSCSCLWHAGMLLEQASVGGRQSDSYSNNPVEVEVWGNPDRGFIHTCCLFQWSNYSAVLLVNR